MTAHQRTTARRRAYVHYAHTTDAPISYRFFAIMWRPRTPPPGPGLPVLEEVAA